VVDQGRAPTRRYPYAASLSLADDGTWTGDAHFTLTPAEVDALVGRGSEAAVDRLQAVLPIGWQARAEVSRGKTTVVIVGRFRAPAIAFHRLVPFRSRIALPPPELVLRGHRRVLYAAQGSTMEIVAPSMRIDGSRPSSVVRTDGDVESRVVTLDTIDPGEGAGSSVVLQIDSDAAMRVRQGLFGQGLWATGVALLVTLGLSGRATRRWLTSVVRRSVRRRGRHRVGGQPVVVRAREDISLFGEAYMVYHEDLLRFFVRQVLDPEHAFALMAETFADALGHLHEWNGANEASGRKWMWSIARRRLESYCVQREVLTTNLRRLSIGMASLGQPEYERIERMADLTRFETMLDRGRGEFTDEHALLLHGRVVRGRGYEDVAWQDDVTLTVVRERSSRALRALATELRRLEILDAG
jgi:DNA-directed RNA polymerase specialized sigma24 family protein